VPIPLNNERREAQAAEFLRALARNLSPEERMVACGFVGDPDKTDVHAWRPRPWAPGKEWPLGVQANAYVTVSSFTVSQDGSWRRRGETFAAGHALMVDDVGTKVPHKVVECLRPSAMVETSPGNFQAWYFLREPLRDKGRFDAIIRAFISGQLLGADPGMAGVTRVGRVPGHVNAKKKYLSEDGWPWVVRTAQLDPDLRYAPEEIVGAFGLKLVGTTERRPRLVPEDARTRIEAYVAHYGWLKAHGVLKSEEPDASGWIQIHCPWVGDHTGAADTGAAICEPNPDNGYSGGYRCHHGHCAGKGWRELTDWIMDATAEALERANNTAEVAQ